MDQLRFTGLYEDGQHAVLTAADGSEFLVAIDDRLRAAVRRPSASSTARTSPATPREVQTQIRGGASAEDVAESTGWTVERIARYEGPILDERAYLAGLARTALIRTHERSEAPPTLESRVRERLNKRGVDLSQVSWDSIRPAGGSWSVQVHFKAGQRARSASWSFDPDTRSVDAIDDEARWLSEDEQSLPAGAAATALLGGGSDAPDDLMSAMRERSKRRGASGRRRKPAPDQQPGDLDDVSGGTGVTGGENDGDVAGLDIASSAHTNQDPTAAGQPDIPDTALPLEDLPYDPDTVGLPSAAGRDETANGAQEAGQVGDHGRDDLGGGEPDGETAGDEEGDGSGDLDLSPEDDDDSDDSDLNAGDDDSGADEEEEREATLADFFGSDDDDEAKAADHGDHTEPANDIESADDGSPEAGAPGDSERPARPAQDDKASSRGRKGRTKVPSWDDIMFGAKDRGR